MGVSNVDRNEIPAVEVLKVSSRSNPNAVAGALAGVIRERGYAEIQGIGAGAVNQAIKAWLCAVCNQWHRRSVFPPLPTS